MEDLYLQKANKMVNVNPNFLPQWLKPSSAGAAPEIKADQTAGAIGSGLSDLSKSLNGFREQKLKDELALREQAMNELKNKFGNAYTAANTLDVSNKAEAQGMQNSALRDLSNTDFQGGSNPMNGPMGQTPMGQTPTPATADASVTPPPVTPAPPVGAPTDVNNPPAPPAPVADPGTYHIPEQLPISWKDKGYKFDAEKEAVADPAYGKTLNEYKKMALGDGKLSDFYRQQKTFTKEVTGDKIVEEFNKQSQLSPPLTQNEGRSLLMVIDPQGKLDKNVAMSLIKDLPTNWDVSKQNNLEGHQKTMEDLTRTNQQTTQTREADKFIQTQKENLGKDLEKGDYVKLAGSYQGVKDNLDKALAQPGAFKTLQGLAASSGDTNSLMAVLANSAARLPIASWIAPNNITDVKMKLAKEYLDTPAGQAVMKDPNFQKLSVNLFDLINTDLKRASGTAVTSAEMERFMNKMGLSVWNGDPGQLRDALDKYGKDINAQVKGITSRYNPDAINAYTEGGGVIPRVNDAYGKQPKFAGKPKDYTKDDRDAIKWAIKNPGPDADKIKAYYGMQ